MSLSPAAVADVDRTSGTDTNTNRKVLQSIFQEYFYARKNSQY